MSDTTIQDILPLVQKPSRYLGSEINRIRKPWEEVQLHIALAFPDLYEIASSHFGIQILYEILNARNDILAERVFAPAMDMEAQLRENGLALFSLESKRPIATFDIIGFSLLYELNYTNMVNMLDLSGIPLFSRKRNDAQPLVIAGGPCMCNPEPVADFFDAIVVGDGESVILEMADAWKDWRTEKEPERGKLLQAWSKIRGVYIPSFFDVGIDSTGRHRIVPEREDYPCVEKAVVSDMDAAPFPEAPIIPFGKPIHDRLRMEIARGCTRGCRFCQAGMIYRPVRERRPETIVSAARQSLQQTGYEDLSLLSLSTGDYSCIAPIMEQIMDFGETDNIAVSLPSLRAGSLSPELMDLIRRVRKTGFTIAPEAGSQRLRDVINKNISEADITQTVENAFALGWKLIKLYFMIGLPTETQDDIEAIVTLVKRLKKATNDHGRRGRINVSIATFVPKPHTPFQWEPQITLAEATQKLNWLKDNLSGAGVQVKWQDPRVSFVEGVWARGDRRLGRLLIDAWKSGCRFDGWSDYFNFERWVGAFEKQDFDPRQFTLGTADTKQPLPWDHIRIGVDRWYLERERQRARNGKITMDCRTGDCSGCGVCDFSTIKPVSFHDRQPSSLTKSPIIDPKPTDAGKTYGVTFKKLGSARFLGHLEMIKIFIRGVRRAKIPIKYSHGFHPMPRLSFLDTLPVGMQSEDERMFITLKEPMDPEKLISDLEPQLPEGLELTGCSTDWKAMKQVAQDSLSYHVELKDGFFRQKDLNCFFEQSQVNIERMAKKGRAVIIDLKEAVTAIEILDHRHAVMTIGRVDNLTVRPARLLNSIFELSDRQIQTAIITKRKADHV